MAFSVTRLTIYALLSAIEEDLREAITRALGAGADPVPILGESLHQNALRRLTDELGSGRRDPTLQEILPYTDLGDLVEILNRHKKVLPEHVQNQLRQLNPQLQLILPVRKRIAHVRPFRYDDLARVTTFTEQVSAEDPITWQSVTETLARLTQDPSFVFRLPEPRYYPPPNAPHNNLPLPDYDDTGFLGRDAEVQQVINLCKGPWPVISLVGEGGLGKTALALQIANELLDDGECPFEAIIWSSSKVNQLTPTQIRDISGAIRDSMGLFQSVVRELSGQNASDPESELIDFLATFRTLLILDNLETILDDRIRQFINRLPAGSKLLVTSRIGIGEFENRVKLQPLPSSIATRLLRVAADLGGVHHLSRLPQQQLGDMCDRMGNNPLFIKWFVSAVQTGARPEDILAKPDLFLDFCMSNVYEHLSDLGKRVLRVIQAIPEDMTLAEVTYFNGGHAFDTQAALQEVLTTNMMVMNSTPQGSVVESRYLLTEMARQYLNKNHPLTGDEDYEFESLRRQLETDKALLGKKLSGDPYDYQTVWIRSNSDYIVAKYLLQALKFAESEQFDRALDEISSAKQLAADYYEVYRVEAQVLAASANLRAADEAFRAAIEIEPDSAPLRLFYAAFLRQSRRDVDAALSQVDFALKRAPDDPYVLLEHARCSLDVLSFASARKSIDKALALAQSALHESDAWHLDVEFYQRLGSFCIDTKEYSRAMDAMTAVRQSFDSIPPTIRDQLVRQLSACYGTLWCVINDAGDDALSVRAKDLLSWLDSVPGQRRPPVISLSSERMLGVVRYRHPAKPFAFLTAEGSLDVFLGRNNMRFAADFDLLRPGVRVSFIMAIGENGRKALDTTID